MEEPRWHKIVFRHRCGFKGRISTISISVTKPYTVSISGHCDRCETEFELQEHIMSMINSLNEAGKKSTERKTMDLADMPDSFFADGKIN